MQTQKVSILACALFVLTLCFSGLAVGASQSPNPGSYLTSQGPWLVFDYSLGMGMGAGGYKIGGAKFEVQVSDGGPFKTLYKSIYGTMRWYPYALDLSEYAGKKIKVRFSAEHIEGRILMDYPHWGNPRLMVGGLFGKTPPKELFNFSMTPIERAGGVLPDGTEFVLTEPDPVFGDKLVTKGLLNREHMLLVYAGNNYICVPGKAQPGIFMGVSMSVDYLRIGCDPLNTPYTGKMPPPVFAEWTVDVPAAPPSVAAPAAQVAKSSLGSGPFVLLSTKEDKYLYKAGLVAKCDRQTMTLDVNMGNQADLGWAFAGIEAVNLPKVSLDVQKSGTFDTKGPNSFAGLIVDYHTLAGYQKRVFMGLGAGSAERYDLRPGSWIYDAASMSLRQRLDFRSEFIDISGQLKGNHSVIDLDIAKFAPADWDGRVWVAAGVQNQGSDAGLKLTFMGLKSYTPNAELKTIPAKQGRFLLVDGGERMFAISKVNGAICGGWVKKGGKRIFTESNDTYAIERLTSITESSELYDKVTSSKWTKFGGRPALVISCKNHIFPDVTITKRYMVAADGSLIKRVGFRTSDKGGFFLRYICSTGIDTDWRKTTKGYGAMVSRKVVAQGKVVELTDEVVLEQAGVLAAPMLIAKDSSLGIASFRYRVNDKFVLRASSSGSRGGWTSKVFTDFVKAGQEVSGENRWVFFKGDFTVFQRYYQNLPEYKALFEIRHPEWTKRILSDAMYVQNGQEAFMNAAFPLLVTDTIWFLCPPWGNWGGYHTDPNNWRHPDVYGIAPGYRSAMPNARLAKYNNYSFDAGSDVYRDHPEYGVRDRSGALQATGCNSDSTKSASFFFQVANPVVKKALIDMHTSQIRDWRLDYLYTDGPGFGAEEIDWGYMDVTQGYDWLQYLKELMSALKNVNPDLAFFSNGMMPLSDIGYIENRDEQWLSALGPDWRAVAMDLLSSKFDEPEGYIIVPTYGTISADPSLSAYTVMYGWAGNLNYLQRLPWMRAAWEYRGIKLVEDAVEPRWYKTDITFEANAFRKGSAAILNVINHDTKPQDVTVTLDTAKLGLKKGAPIYAWLMRMNDTPRIENPLDPASKIIDGSDRAMTPSVLFWGRPCEASMKITVPTDPSRLYSVVLSPTPAILESVDGKNTETGFTEHLDVTVRGKSIQNGAVLDIDCRADKASILIPGYASTAGIVTSWPSSVVDWCGQKAVRVTVGRGTHTVKIIKAVPIPSTTVCVCDFSGETAVLWTDTQKPEGTVIDVRKVEGYDYNSALRVEGNNAAAYTRQPNYVSPTGKPQRYLVCEFAARILKADANNTPAEVSFNISGGSEPISALVQFRSQGAAEYPMQIVCNGQPMGAFRVSPAAMTPDGAVEWYHVKVVFDKKDGKVTLLRDDKQITQWALPGKVDEWTMVRIDVTVPEGSGNGKAEYDNFKVITTDVL